MWFHFKKLREQFYDPDALLLSLLSHLMIYYFENIFETVIIILTSKKIVKIINMKYTFILLNFIYKILYYFLFVFTIFLYTKRNFGDSRELNGS